MSKQPTLDFLDSNTTRIFAVEAAGSAEGARYDAALEATRTVEFNHLADAADLWAAQNGFHLENVVPMDFGVTVVINDSGDDALIETAQYPFDLVLSAFNHISDNFTVHNIATKESVHY